MSYGRAKWALCAFFMAVLGTPAAAQQANLPAEVWSAIAEMGPTLNQEVIRKSVALMKPLQAPRTGLSASQDVAYGPDPLQKLDLYQPQASAAGSAPIVILVHGGGFTGGDKEIGESAAAYFARHGRHPLHSMQAFLTMSASDWAWTRNLDDDAYHPQR